TSTGFDPRSLHPVDRDAREPKKGENQAITAYTEKLEKEKQSPDLSLRKLASTRQEAPRGLIGEGLTKEKVYSNGFVFNFAGHDATANSLAIGEVARATQTAE
ncbi:MAG: hypothetical protein OHK93_003351, partial [Ramalina farinacea]|nr:hypothetical protein [Ramalina farinacea]